MSFCVEQIVLLAGNIYSGLPSPNSQSVGLISGWIVQSGNLGDLNNRLNTCFTLTGDSPCVVGGFGPAEASIYGLIYRTNYLEQQSANVLAAGGLMWTSMKEGDTTITRSDPVNSSKVWLSLHESSQRALYVAVANWKRGESLFNTVEGSSLYSWPTP